MLTPKFKKLITSLLHIDEAKLNAAIAAEAEVEVEGFNPDEPGVQAFTDAELETRDTEAVRKKTKELTDAGIEIAVKKMKTATGFNEYDGKDPVEFVTKFKESALKTAKLEPAAQVAEKEKEIAALTATVAQAKKEAEDARAMIGGIKRERDLISKFPAGRSGDLSDDERLVLFNMRYEPTEVEGVGTVWKDKTTGEELRDTKTGKAKATDEIVTAFFTEKKWIAGAAQEKGGRGGTDSKTGATGGNGKPAKWSEAKESWEAEGKNINDARFTLYLNECQTAHGDAFEMDLPNG